MNPTLNWDFTLANYGPVWSFMVQIGLLLIFLLLGNLLRRTIPLFRKYLIPSALLGGGMLLIVDIIAKQLKKKQPQQQQQQKKQQPQQTTL